MSLLLLWPTTSTEVTSTIIAKVERLLHARLVETGGERVDAFTSHTRPTRTQVLGFIDDYASLLYVRTGELESLACERSSAITVAAEVLIAQRVALEIEQAYWPEEVGEFANPETRRAALDADTDMLVTGVDRCRDESAGGDGDSGSRSDPAWCFPPAVYLRF